MIYHLLYYATKIVIMGKAMSKNMSKQAIEEYISVMNTSSESCYMTETLTNDVKICAAKGSHVHIHKIEQDSYVRVDTKCILKNSSSETTNTSMTQKTEQLAKAYAAALTLSEGETKNDSKELAKLHESVQNTYSLTNFQSYSIGLKIA